MNTAAQAASTTDTPSLGPAFRLGLGVAIGNGFARFSYALLLPAMRADLGWSYATSGWLNTANALGYIIGAVSGYLLLRRMRPSQLFIAGLLLTFIVLAITGARPNMAWLTLTRLASGVGAAWVFACGGALVAARYKSSPRLGGTATGLFFAGAGVGIAATGVLVNPVLAYLGNAGWPTAWVLLGSIAGLLAIWPLAEARRIDGAANSASTRPLNLTGLIPSLFSYFLFACGYIVYMTFIFAWVRQEAMSWQFGTVVWVVLGCSVAVSPFAWRAALDSWNPAVTLAASCATTLVGAVLPVLSATAVSVLVSAALFGLGMFIAPSSVAMLARRTMASTELAKTITLFTVVFSIGQAIGPSFAGWIADVSALSSALLMGAALLAAASCAALVRLGQVSARIAPAEA